MNKKIPVVIDDYTEEEKKAIRRFRRRETIADFTLLALSIIAAVIVLALVLDYLK